jgi:prepilin-type N-terminal cleavage/methylation domain-containing protein
MTSPRTVRRGLSLIELLVVIAVLAVLLGLVLGAVQQVRRSAQRVTNANNLHQIALATHNWATVHGHLPRYVIEYPDGNRGSMFAAILPYIDGGALYQSIQQEGKWFKVHVFINPADPTVSLSNITPSAISYGANAHLFQDGPQFTAITDGTANTIAFAEHYANCRNTPEFHYTLPFPYQGVGRRATFSECNDINGPCNRLCCSLGDIDVGPYTSGSPPVTIASVRGLTFQAGPKVQDCDPRLAQSPNPGGMQVALADGSVRTLQAGIAETVYWAIVTPRCGEVASVE